MKKTTKFSIQDSKENAERRVLSYFLQNGYYKLKSKSGLKFTKDPDGKTILSPKRHCYEVDIHVKPTDTGAEIEQVIQAKPLNLKMSVIDEEYVDAIADHFSKAIQSNKIDKFADDQYESEARKFGWNFLWLTLGIGAVIFAFEMWFSLVTDLYTLAWGTIFIAPVLAIIIINRKIIRKRLSGEN